jgi:hypothetical protein
MVPARGRLGHRRSFPAKPGRQYAAASNAVSSYDTVIPVLHENKVAGELILPLQLTTA